LAQRRIEPSFARVKRATRVEICLDIHATFTGNSLERLGGAAAADRLHVARAGPEIIPALTVMGRRSAQARAAFRLGSEGLSHAVRGFITPTQRLMPDRDESKQHRPVQRLSPLSVGLLASLIAARRTMRQAWLELPRGRNCHKGLKHADIFCRCPPPHDRKPNSHQ
jgi:hypothetical protein